MTGQCELECVVRFLKFLEKNSYCQILQKLKNKNEKIRLRDSINDKSNIKIVSSHFLKLERMPTEYPEYKGS